MKSVGIIPARYASTRFPGKPLALIGNKSMIQRVYEKSVFSDLDDVYIATDDTRIKEEAEKFGAKVIMTSSKISNGTLRCAKAYEKIGKEFDIIINIQGDEPFIDPKQINILIKSFKDKGVQISTLIDQFENLSDLESPHNIKVVIDKNSFALYFSRSVIPYLRNIKKSEWLDNQTFYKHIGIYAFRSGVFKEIIKLRPVAIEQSESLEQLRWLFNGYKIKTNLTKYYGISVDTPEDLDKANMVLNTVYD